MVKIMVFLVVKQCSLGADTDVSEEHTAICRVEI
jgi:hypothetical protein